MDGVIKIPANSDYASLPFAIYAQIICMIPEGKVSTQEAILDYCSKRYGKHYVDIEYPATVKPTLKADIGQGIPIAYFTFIAEHPGQQPDKDDLIPYWRIISARGFLTGPSKDSQKAKLEKEGHTVVEGNGSGYTLRLENYKEKLFDLNSIQSLETPPAHKSRTIELQLKANIGDPVFWINSTDPVANPSAQIVFYVSVVEDGIDRIAITRQGVQYFVVDDEDPISAENNAFFTKEECEQYLAEHCSEFNAANIHFGDPVYHDGLVDTIKGAYMMKGEVIIKTANGNLLAWKNKGRSFTLEN